MVQPVIEMSIFSGSFILRMFYLSNSLIKENTEGYSTGLKECQSKWFKNIDGRF